MKRITKQIIVGVMALLLILSVFAGAIAPEPQVQQQENWGTVK